jgi:hypothetical protein
MPGAGFLKKLNYRKKYKNFLFCRRIVADH